MPLYYFHLDGDGVSRDEDGSELKDLEAAKCTAVQLIAETLCYQPHKFWDADSYKVTVTDEKGLVLFIVEMVATLSAAVPARRR